MTYLEMNLQPKSLRSNTMWSFTLCQRFRRRLACECHIIDNWSGRRREGLICNSGANFGMPGRRDFDIFPSPLNAETGY